jgi:hypothetical protein
MEVNILFGNAQHISYCFIFSTFVVIVIKNKVSKSANAHHRQNFLHLYAIVCHCIYLLDDDLVDVGTCKRNINDK